MADYVTEEEVRMFILDRTAADNDLDWDLSFSTEEVVAAMKRAAREFNSIPPFVLSVSENCLPNDTNIFLEATAEQLYRAQQAKLMRNDMDYTAGGVGTNLNAKRIEHLKFLIKQSRENWMPAARDFKIARNINLAFREFI